MLNGYKNAKNYFNTETLILTTWKYSKLKNREYLFSGIQIP